MSVLSRFVPALALVLPLASAATACVDDLDDLDDETFRAIKTGCVNCHISHNTVYMGLASEYDPADITGVIVMLSNSGGNETIDYGTTISVPSEPNTVAVVDNELCTVGRTEQPPTYAYVEFEITDAAGTYTVGNEIPIDSTCP